MSVKIAADTDGPSGIILITEEGFSSSFPKEQVGSVLALALISWCGNPAKAMETLGKAWAEHEAFAATHPELKEH